jgi:hypothetical protein
MKKQKVWTCAVVAAGLFASTGLASAQPIPVGPELNALIVRQSGWWKTDVSMSGESGSDTAYVCVDATREAKFLHDMSNMLAKASIMGCPTTSYSRIGATVQGSQVCKNRFSGSSSTTTTYSGNTKSSQTVTSESVASDGTKMTIKSVHTFRGACPAGFKGGDSVTSEELAKKAPPPYTNLYDGKLSKTTEDNAKDMFKAIVDGSRKSK